MSNAPSSFEALCEQVHGEFNDLLSAHATTPDPASPSIFVDRYLITDSLTPDVCEPPYGALLAAATIVALQRVDEAGKIELIDPIMQPRGQTTTLMAMVTDKRNGCLPKWAMVNQAVDPDPEHKRVQVHPDDYTLSHDPFGGPESLKAFRSFIQAIGNLADRGALHSVTLEEVLSLHRARIEMDRPQP